MTKTSRTTSTSIRTLPIWVWRMSVLYLCVILISYIFALPVRYMQLLNNPNLTPALATIQLLIDYLLVVATTVLGFFLVLRRHTEFIAVLMGVTLMVTLPNISGMSNVPVFLHPLFHIPSGLGIIGAAPLAFLLIISMPDGYPRPRKLLWIIGFMLIFDTIRYVLLFMFPPANVLSIRPIAIIPNMIFIGIAAYNMRRRYRYHASPTQRQQFKWVFLGILIAVAVNIGNQAFRVITLVLGVNIPSTQLIVSFTSTVGGIILCVSLILAISRYGLWNVDLTINRSMVAGLVTMSLMMVFGGIFWVSQTALRMILGENRSEVAIAISALVVGIAFNPVRHRVRTFVDRRLYGFRFNLNQLASHQTKANIAQSGAFTGRTVGGYTLLNVIGRGNMGEVYRAVKDEQYVAVKIMQAGHHVHHNLRGRFEREGKIMLEHPNIIKTLGGGEENNLVYVVMEYIEGRTLKELLQEREHFNLQDIHHHLHALAKAMDYAHKQGYVHRDIKPSNILLRAGGTNRVAQIMLMDFGIAKFLGDTGTLTGSDAVGTIDYMSPEQIMDSTTVDHRADIYALGIVLYETLSGVLPFQGSLAQILFAHINQPPPNIRNIRPDIPLPIANALQRAMQKDPSDRFQSATEFVNA
ncbi:MAG: serine/threonine protein kinase, partial [Anaerolineae bacterium]|nr:serine/threonine protein kinase [Anaerolineae bacterium]